MLRMAVVLSFGLLVAALSARASAAASAPAVTRAEVEQAVVAAIPAWHGQKAAILQYLDLTAPFHTATPWAFVVARDPHQRMTGFLGAMNPLALCFVHGRSPHCSEAQLCGVVPTDQPARHRASTLNAKPCAGNPIYDTGDSYRQGVATLRVVDAGTRLRGPLLLLKTGDLPGGDGNHNVQTVLYRYIRTSDRFQPVFVNDSGGSNNNQYAQFVAHGPLQGDEIVDFPTAHAPYEYWIEVYVPRAAGMYRRILRYRSATHYADGNPLPVADSEMPGIMRRLGLWKPGDALPVPNPLPATCGRLILRDGEEWCRNLCIKFQRVDRCRFADAERGKAQDQ